MGTTTMYDLGPDGLCYITVPPGFDPDAANIPMILYCHGSGGAPNQWATLSAWAAMRAWCDANGWIVVEGTGGGNNPPANDNGFSWGNASGYTGWLACLDKAEDLYDIGARVLLGRSMGGLGSAYMFTQSDRAADFDGWINNSGVSTMLYGTTGGSGSMTMQKFGANVYPAFGYSYDDGVSGSSQPNYTAVRNAILAADIAPDLWASSVWAGKKILACYGDADTTVPWITNGGGAMLSTWLDGGAEVTLALTPGGTHAAPGSYGSPEAVAAMTTFLSQFAGDPPEPTVKTYTRVKARFIKLSDGIHRVHTVPV